MYSLFRGFHITNWAISSNEKAARLEQYENEQNKRLIEIRKEKEKIKLKSKILVEII